MHHAAGGGHAYPDYPDFFWGSIEHVSLFNRVLTPAEILADRDAVKNGTIGASCLSSRDCLPGLRCDTVRTFRLFFS